LRSLKEQVIIDYADNFKRGRSEVSNYWVSKRTNGFTQVSFLNTLLMIEWRLSSETHGAEFGVLFALREEVHVLLAHVNLVGALLEAVQ
jgi:hypothetical protein